MPTHDPRREIEKLRDHLASHDKALMFLFGAGTSCAVTGTDGTALVPARDKLITVGTTIEATIATAATPDERRNDVTRPDMQPVDSSSVATIGYDPGTQELWVEFTSGTTYVYSEVPEIVYEELMNSDSKGSYFNRDVRNAYAFRQE